MATAVQLPFKAEYAKTGRSKCKICKELIDKAELRIGVYTPSPFHDGRDCHWHHSLCFFQKKRPASVGDMEDFETLRYEDQEMIKSKIAAVAGTGPSTSAGSGKGKGKGKKEAADDFSIGYAKSARSECVACEEKILKDVVRISKKDFVSEKAVRFAQGKGLDRWHHVDCFVKIRQELEFFASASDIPGFKDLDREDQAMLKKKLPVVSQSKRKLEDANGANGNGTAPTKKLKTESGQPKQGKSGKSEEELVKAQLKLIYKNRDAVGEGEGKLKLKRAEIEQILRSNKQEVPTADKGTGDPEKAKDLLADIMTFGAMKKCKDCKTGQFTYKSGVGYQCLGYISEFTKCNYIMDGDVERVPFKVPLDFKDHPVFEGKSFKVTKRVIPKHAAPVKGKPVADSNQTYEGPKIVKNPLGGFKFVVFGVDDKEKAELEERIKHFGGKMSSKCSGSTAAAITTTDEFNKSSKEVERAKKYGVPVVSTEFVKNVKDVNYKLTDEMSKFMLSDYVKDVRTRLKTLNQEFEKAREEKERKESESKVKKMRLKDGAVIDPDSGLDDGPYHILKEGNLFYNCVLNRINVAEGKNSFYKLQIIESDRAPKSYHVFRAWGRIGTTVGKHQTDDHPSREDAVNFFLEKYYELTQNCWGPKFVKKPGDGLYFRVELDYGQSEQKEQKLVPNAEDSQLPIPVQSLISLIFDVEIMKRTLMEFEIDMNKMPLGKISRKQLLEAYTVLSESFNLREKEKDERKLNRMIQDVTNRFFSLIPHDFGHKTLPLLDNDELLKAKLEMLDNLMEIEIAYELLAQGDKAGGSGIDSHYKTLKADIDVLETQSEEFNVIKKYLANTHAPTHSNYTLELEQVFKVVRTGENKRYEPFKNLHNRRLLWHGSRISNFVGIISQGLRIAPPEAPVTGYMFGKGIYFADMVSKSANYCSTSRDNPTGLLMLCEVALGDMHELKQAKDSIKKAPKNTHSVKGIGETEPDPTETYTFPDGVMVPYGKPTKSKTRDTALLYNEYIVYDVAQVNIKYLLKVTFNYNSRGRR